MFGNYQRRYVIKKKKKKKFNGMLFVVNLLRNYLTSFFYLIRAYSFAHLGLACCCDCSLHHFLFTFPSEVLMAFFANYSL